MVGACDEARVLLGLLTGKPDAMCPLCIGSALLLATGASSFGGLALVVARVRSAGAPPMAPRELSHPPLVNTPCADRPSEPTKDA
jgi:hypothetical protein